MVRLLGMLWCVFSLRDIILECRLLFYDLFSIAFFFRVDFVSLKASSLCTAD